MRRQQQAQKSNLTKYRRLRNMTAVMFSVELLYVAPLPNLSACTWALSGVHAPSNMLCYECSASSERQGGGEGLKIRRGWNCGTSKTQPVFLRHLRLGSLPRQTPLLESKKDSAKVRVSVEISSEALLNGNARLDNDIESRLSQPTRQKEQGPDETGGTRKLLLRDAYSAGLYGIKPSYLE